MPLTTTSTVVTEIKTTETVYPTCFIRNAFDPAVYLDHADPEDKDPLQVRLVNIQNAKAWKLDKDNSSKDLSIFSAARGVVVTYHLNDYLQLDHTRESVRKWHIEKAEAARYRIAVNSGDIAGKVWTINAQDHTVRLTDPAKDGDPLEAHLKQQWVFEPVDTA